jgi:hypothetical protein
MPNRENNFPPPTIRTVAQRANFLCSKPDCRILTTASRPYFEQALDILVSSLGPDHPTTQGVRRNLESLPGPGT